MFTPVRFKTGRLITTTLLGAALLIPLMATFAQTTGETTQTNETQTNTSQLPQENSGKDCPKVEGMTPNWGHEIVEPEKGAWDRERAKATGEQKQLLDACYKIRVDGILKPNAEDPLGIPLAPECPDKNPDGTPTFCSLNANNPNYNPITQCVDGNCNYNNVNPNQATPGSIPGAGAGGSSGGGTTGGSEFPVVGSDQGTLVEPGAYDPNSLQPNQYFNDALSNQAFLPGECNNGVCVGGADPSLISPDLNEAGMLPAMRDLTSDVAAEMNFEDIPSAPIAFLDGLLPSNVDLYTDAGISSAWREAFNSASLPFNTTPIPSSLEQVNINSQMNPLLELNGSESYKTKDYAGHNMSKVLAGPYKELQKKFGQPLTINDAIAKAGTSREKNTSGSQHFHGTALDISTRGMTDDEKIQLVQAAKEVGFQGYGFGENILHLDMGSKRAWDYGNSTFAGVSTNALIRDIKTSSIPKPDLNSYSSYVSASPQSAFYDSSSLCTTCAGVGSTPASIPNQIAKAPTTPTGGVQYPPNVVARVGNAVGSLFSGGGLFGGASGGGSNPFGSLFGGGSSGGGSNSGYNPYQNQNTYQNQIAQSREYSNRLLDSLVAQQRQQLQQYYVTADTSNRNLAQLKTLLQQQRQQLQQFAYQYPDADQNFIRSMDRAMAEYIQAIEQLERVQANAPNQTTSASQVQQQIDKLLSDINRLETETESNVNTSVASDLTVAALRANKTLTGEYRFRGSLSRTLQNASDTSAFTEVGNYFGSNVAHELLLDLKCDGTVDEKLRFNTPYYSILPRTDGADVLLSEYLEVPEEGLHCFAFAVDVNNLIPEQNENNNQSQWREFIAGAAAETEGNPTLPPLNFDVAVYNSNYSSIIRDWTDADITMGEGQQLVFRWDAPEYQECVPLLSSVTPGSADNTSPVERNTLSENVEIHEHTGYYEIRCSTEGATRVETIHVKVE